MRRGRKEGVEGRGVKGEKRVRILQEVEMEEVQEGVERRRYWEKEEGRGRCSGRVGARGGKRGQAFGVGAGTGKVAF